MLLALRMLSSLLNQGISPEQNHTPATKQHTFKHTCLGSFIQSELGSVIDRDREIEIEKVC